MSYTKFPIQIYNSLSRQVEPLSVSQEEVVKIYSCGPTVYAEAHIGNLRSYIFSDLLRKTLKLSGYSVNMAMNITDVDDKIIDNLYKIKFSNQKKVQASIEDLQEYTKPFQTLFFEHLELLEIDHMEHYPKATEHIDEMIQLISQILDNGYGYEKDGSIYFSIEKFHDYGKLSQVDLSNIKPGIRYNTDEYTKDDVRDFVLWKATRQTHDIFWSSPFGNGRPGWHLECSTMVESIFNGPIHIHMGGVDLIFPHHDNEIAQSCCGYKHNFVDYWMHCEHLLVDGKKMSKSLNNFYTLQDVLDKNFHSLVLRYALISTHYRQKLNFTWEYMEQVQNTLEKIWMCYSKTLEKETMPISEALVLSLETYDEELSCLKSDFLKALQEDLNISKALALFHKFIHLVNTCINQLISDQLKQKLLETFQYFDQVLCILKGYTSIVTVNTDLDDLLQRREEARKSKNFSEADVLRDKIANLGYELQDTSEGPRLYKK